MVDSVDPTEVRFFAAIEVDGEGLDPYAHFLDDYEGVCRVTETSCDYWRFAMDDGHSAVTGNDRLLRICCGRNMAHEYAQRNGASHILFVDSDVRVPGDTIPKLLELDHPIVGGFIGAYAGVHWYDGPSVPTAPGDTRIHWDSAGCLMVASEVFSRVAWNYDLSAGNTDDPAFQRNVEELLGYQTWVRHDLLCEHVGPCGVEGRGAERVPW